MKKKHAIKDRNQSIVTCIGIGLVASVIISLILIIAVTSLIQKGKLNENGNLGVFIIRTVAALIGSLLGAGLSQKKVLPVIGSIAGGYFFVLLSVGLLFLDGSFSNVWQGLVSVVIGGALACIIKLKPQRSRRKKVRFAK